MKIKWTIIKVSEKEWIWRKTSREGGRLILSSHKTFISRKTAVRNARLYGFRESSWFR